MTAARAPRVSDGVIADLRERIASLETTTVKKAGCLAFGVPEMDAALPGGGLAHGALHEFAGGGIGYCRWCGRCSFRGWHRGTHEGADRLVSDTAGSVFPGTGAGWPSCRSSDFC
ncbi:hypothetical protein QE432_005415 [Agrobacterium sp. SORGH_AS 745]|nr:hypothetical protein [Agrobacterium sp. SORGH_AS_0745]